MKFELMMMDWFKRRPPVGQPQVVGFEVRNFEKVDNKYCTITVTYDDGQEFILDARINVNELATPPRWTANGLDSKGHSLLVKLIE